VNFVRLIAFREIREVLRELRFWVSLVLLGLGLPIFYASIATGQETGGGFYFWLLLVMLLPATYSVQTAIISFVGEKEAKTIEPLLVTPITEMQLFAGKILASAIPPLFLSAFSAVTFLSASETMMRRKGYQIGWEHPMVLNIFALVVLVVCFMVGIGVFISSRTSNVRTGQQMTALITLPTLFLVLGKGDMILQALLTIPEIILNGFLLVNILLFYAGSRFMRRETLLSKL
jgi:ABC-type Na+ efflux pump permease subunit